MFDDEKIRAQVERLREHAMYPPVQYQPPTPDGVPAWLVCANGHRWMAREVGECRTCREQHLYRVRGRTECIHPDCHKVPDCSEAAWQAGVRECRFHWEVREMRENVAVGLIHCGDRLDTPVMAEYPVNVRWNGWLRPMMDPHQIMVFSDQLEDDFRFDWDGETLLWFDPLDDEVLRIEPNKDGLYDVSLGLTWFADREDQEEE